jgi:hypothetical protein
MDCLLSPSEELGLEGIIASTLGCDASLKLKHWRVSGATPLTCVIP